MECNDEYRAYFDSLEAELSRCMEVAGKARSLGRDPSPEVEIPVAHDLADRVEALIQLPGVAERIRQLDSEHNGEREPVALQVALEVARGDIGGIGEPDRALETAIRCAVAVLTEGVVAAPTEGIAAVELAKNDDGTQYIRIYYAGPIRSAGGTAQALSVLTADYVRRQLGIGAYQPRPEEVQRYVLEVQTYERQKGLQYHPTEEELTTIVANCPISVDGEPTEDYEVAGFRDLERIPTNRVRGGVALVIAEGIALKAPKLRKYVAALGLDGWEWLEGLGHDAAGVEKNNRGLQVEIEDDENGETDSESLQPGSSDKFLSRVIGGRPVFSNPSAKGGFRLRLGRSRNTGLAAAGLNPVTMELLGGFIAPGTQMKIERPGKGAAIAPVSGIEGPTVLLDDGEVRRLDTPEELAKYEDRVVRILDVGEILLGYGEFLENNHVLLPAGWCHEWWEREVDAAGRSLPGPGNGAEALAQCQELGVPLHPDYTYFWHDITPDEYQELRQTVSKDGELVQDELRIRASGRTGSLLQELLVPHRVEGESIVIGEPQVLIACLGLNEDLSLRPGDAGGSTLEVVNRMSGISVFPRAPTRIGGSMGRPEKAKMREMKPPVHLLFPLGESGGSQRDLLKPLNGRKQQKRGKKVRGASSSVTGGAGVIEVEMGVRRCGVCNKETYSYQCDDCGNHTVPVARCPVHNLKPDSRGRCPRCGKVARATAVQRVDLRRVYLSAVERLGVADDLKVLKGVKGLTSVGMAPEPMEKGILRARNGVTIFKDGTVRFDMTDLPLTHFTPAEVGTPVERLKELGYLDDVHGRPLEHDEQVLELKIQDLVPSSRCGETMLRVSAYIDELLTRFYDSKPYYELKTAGDLVGHLVVGLAPHTSAGVLGRVIGFTSASVGYAHPYFHAAKRRNCDGDEDCLFLLLDGLLNFSREYLPKSRGSTMDAPMVLTATLLPREVDSEAHSMDVGGHYPLEVYHAAAGYTDPRKVVGAVDLLETRLGTPEQYSGLSYTIETADIAAGPANSTYKLIQGKMAEKVGAQMRLAKLIRAVDERDVAERIIESHLLPDIIGNLRKFCTQQFRCTKCGYKARRPPLRGACPRCGGNMILTVSKGAVVKYVDLALSLAKDFGISPYMCQRLELLKESIESLFHEEPETQASIEDFF